MMKIRRADERGQADHGWLLAKHSFSFADYYDPNYHDFRDLRVINEDRVAPSQGFGTHPHRDMEIITVVLEGGIAHRDSMGHEEILRPGQVQVMSAGTGVEHSERNPSPKEWLHLLQIWIMPDRRNHTPRYETKDFSQAFSKDGLVLVAAPGAVDGAIHINQDAKLYRGKLSAKAVTELRLNSGRHAWVQVIDGELEVNQQTLQAGDGLAISNEELLKFVGKTNSTFLLFDLK